jgi:hypothetical protein
LYFAVELRHEGRLVGRPQLLGELGKRLRVERRQPGASEADYALSLLPKAVGKDEPFEVNLEVAVPNAQGHRRLSLLHGQEKTLELGDGELEVKLLVMRVDSPEFEAFVHWARQKNGEGPGSI